VGNIHRPPLSNNEEATLVHMHVDLLKKRLAARQNSPFYVMKTLCYGYIMLWIHYVMDALCYGYIMLRIHYAKEALCYGYIMLWIHYVMDTLCYGCIML